MSKELKRNKRQAVKPHKRVKRASETTADSEDERNNGKL